MEIHHPHHHDAPGKKEKLWKHYALEFFMLFLAVSAGFFVENFREKMADREKEKQSIESLVRCLASDTLQLKNIIKANTNVVSHLDSLMLLKNADLRDRENKRKFLIHSIVGFNEDWYFRTNDAALEQLKSSGMLRLICKQNIVDSIFTYELKNRAIVAQESDCYFLFKDDFSDFKSAVDLSFFGDTSVLKYDLGYDNSTIVLKDPDAVSISNDHEKVKGLFGNAATLALAEIAYINLMQEQLVYGKRLIAFLKKEYQLD